MRENKAYCSNFDCPSLTDFYYGDISHLDLRLRDEKFVDKAGNTWCIRCKRRYDLMNWGVVRGFPLIQVPPYAIGPGEALWHTAIALGSADMVEVLAASILGTAEESEVI